MDTKPSQLLCVKGIYPTSLFDMCSTEQQRNAPMPPPPSSRLAASRQATSALTWPGPPLTGRAQTEVDGQQGGCILIRVTELRTSSGIPHTATCSQCIKDTKDTITERRWSGPSPHQQLQREGEGGAGALWSRVGVWWCSFDPIQLRTESRPGTELRYAPLGEGLRGQGFLLAPPASARGLDRAWLMTSSSLATGVNISAYQLLSLEERGGEDQDRDRQHSQEAGGGGLGQQQRGCSSSSAFIQLPFLQLPLCSRRTSVRVQSSERLSEFRALSIKQMSLVEMPQEHNMSHQLSTNSDCGSVTSPMLLQLGPLSGGPVIVDHGHDHSLNDFQASRTRRRRGGVTYCNVTYSVEKEVRTLQLAQAKISSHQSRTLMVCGDGCLIFSGDVCCRLRGQFGHWPDTRKTAW
ncbi:hypothetical protein NQZ68_033688 [Dissostichus eleginoides]|nr:hypothetical protein NQZ68_033688 [Dissostichus eleginoides]